MGFILFNMCIERQTVINTMGQMSDVLMQMGSMLLKDSGSASSSYQAIPYGGSNALEWKKDFTTESDSDFD